MRPLTARRIDHNSLAVTLMFVFEKNEFSNCDLQSVLRFVRCWERYYRGDDDLYSKALNVGGDLQEDGIIVLLRWKDPTYLNHPLKKNDEPNQRVIKVLEQLPAINKFRSGSLSTSDYQSITATLFPSGIIWQLFLFHIARPAEWPIADQHVFRAYSRLFSQQQPTSIDSFSSYKESFATLAGKLFEQASIDSTDPLAVVQARKRLDNALVAYGQFLKKYDF